MNYLEFIISNEAEGFKKLINNNLSKEVKFNNLERLPDDKGVYFIYDGNDIVYIGESGSGKNQRMRNRCKQYIGTGTGATFRDKLMNDKNLNINEAIKYIKENCIVKYIIENEHKKLENLAIGLFNPKYNY